MMNGNSHPLSCRRLEGKVAIITGGASGIGAATTRLFACHGATVIVADVQDQLGCSLCRELAPAAVSFVHCDVTVESDIINVVQTALSEHGKLDVMFNNAGISGDPSDTILGGPTADDGNFKRVLEVNLYGAFLGAKHAARAMVPARRGSILFTASLASVVAGETTHAYAASKHAVVGLAKSLCVELGEYGIRVNCISPGAIATPMLNDALGMEKERVEALACATAVLKGAVAEAGDVAEAALFLASEEAKCVTGLNLILDSGYSTTNRAFSTAIKMESIK